MADTGWLTATSATNTTGGGNGDWSNPSNALASDDTYATVTMGAFQISNYLVLYGWGAAIDSGATIDGIEIEIEGFRTAGTKWFNGLWATLSSDYVTQPAGSTVIQQNINLATSEGSVAVGNSTDTWGGNAITTQDWTADEINDPTFAVLVGYAPGTSSGNITHSIDQIRLKVYYTLVDPNAGSEGPNSPSTVVSVAGPATQWANPSNAAASDNSYATMTASATEANNAYLKATNFGFSISSTADILGVTVEIEKHRSGGSSGQIRDDTLQLVTTSGAVGDNKAATGVNWGTALDTYTTYGADDDLWGATLTPSIVNSSDFGVQLRVDNTGNRVANIDHIRITIDYTDDGGDVGSPQLSTAVLFWSFP